MQRISRLPRWLHQFYAWVTGRFWEACPLCNRHFGGHEWKDYNKLSSTITSEVRKNGRTGKGICPACTRAGRGDKSWARHF